MYPTQFWTAALCDVTKEHLCDVVSNMGSARLPTLDFTWITYNFLHTCGLSKNGGKKKVWLRDLEKPITCAQCDQLHNLPLCFTHIAWNCWVVLKKGEKGREREGQPEWQAGKHVHRCLDERTQPAVSSPSSQLQLLLNLVHNTNPVKRLPP